MKTFILNEPPPPPEPEQAIEQTFIDFCRMAAEEARKQSTKKETDER